MLVTPFGISASLQENYVAMCIYEISKIMQIEDEEISQLVNYHKNIYY